MLTTTPFLRPEAGTVPWPMIVRRPSRLTSPMSAQTFVVPTSIPTRTASLSTCRWSPAAGPLLDEVTTDESDVVEDPEAEVDQRDEVEIEAEAIADEREEDGDDRVRDEAADEDPIVVDAVELRADGTEDGIEGGEDRHRRVPAELEADVDIEEETGEDTGEGQEQAVWSSLRCGFGKATRRAIGPTNDSDSPMGAVMGAESGSA